MNAEVKQCENCTKEFTVEPEDFEYYEKIKVPAPTWCPDCRLQRRLSFCNERNLYSRDCSLCGTHIVSMYSKDTPFPVYCLPCYRSDNWDPMSFGRAYDFTRPFFAQFYEMKMQTPRAALVRQGDIAGSEYCNRASFNKNCYLIVRANYNEDSLYSYNLWNSRDCADCFNVHKSELTYQSLDSFECYNTKYCQECRLCRNSYFLFDCRNCSDCIGCVNLRNQQYYILNQPYTKEQYESKVRELRLDTVAGLEVFKQTFEEFKKTGIREASIMLNSTGSTGNWLSNCSNVKDSYQCRDMENGKYLLSVLLSKDCMDHSYWGNGSELIYETANCGYNCSRVRFSNESWDSCSEITYSDNCYSSSNLFGCVGLRKKEYCILNTQHSKEEYLELIEKIEAQMKELPYVDAKGRVYTFGEFFPTEHSASAYNTTAAFDNFPLTESEVLAQGFKWENREEKGHVPTKNGSELPESITEVTDDILKDVILCEAYEKEGGKAAIDSHNCSKAFRITPQELAFYRRMNLPLPRRCFNSRHYLRHKMRNPLKLWPRNCAKCNKGIETSYSPDRPEIVYCESCYQAEVV